jgi:hypothetical protein
MTEYIVRIGEHVTHTLVIEAETENDALERGYQLLTDGLVLTDEEKKQWDYDLESDGYSNNRSVSEL